MSASDPTLVEILIPSAGGIIAAAAALVAAWRANGAKRSADDAGSSAAEAATLSRPTGNGYAEESRSAWRRIDRGIRAVTRATRANRVAIEHLTRAHEETRDVLLQHLEHHARPDHPDRP